MKSYKKILKVTCFPLLIASTLMSSNAIAQIANLPLKVNVNITETLAPLTSDVSRCPVTINGYPVMGIGTIGGAGKLTVTTNSSPKTVEVPVALAASDCPTVAFSFHYGNFVLISPNGSTLKATYEGGFLGAPPSLTIGVSKSTFVIQSGTGDFSGASGSGWLLGNETIYSQTPFMGIGSLQANGTISFSTSNFSNAYRIR